LVSRSRIRKRSMSSLVPSSIATLPGLLGDPSAGGMCCHATNVQSAGVVLNEDQHVDAPEQDRVDGHCPWPGE
jgi:hypothetical protein